MDKTKRMIVHTELSKIFEHVYYQPPTTLVLKYPCVIYDRSDIQPVYSDNRIYAKYEKYDINILYKSVLDESLVDIVIESMDYVKFKNTTIKESVYNTALEITLP